MSNDLLEQSNKLSAWIDIAITLLVCRIVRPDLYSKFLNAAVSVTDLEDYFDATEIRRSREIADERNTDYDHDTWLQFSYWMYLVQDGQLPEEEERIVKEINRDFSGNPWAPNRIRQIPKEAHQMWLDVFTATGA